MQMPYASSGSGTLKKEAHVMRRGVGWAEAPEAGRGEVSLGSATEGKDNDV